MPNRQIGMNADQAEAVRYVSAMLDHYCETVLAYRNNPDMLPGAALAMRKAIEILGVFYFTYGQGFEIKDSSRIYTGHQIINRLKSGRGEAVRYMKDMYSLTENLNFVLHYQSFLQEDEEAVTADEKFLLTEEHRRIREVIPSFFSQLRGAVSLSPDLEEEIRNHADRYGSLSPLFAEKSPLLADLPYTHSLEDLREKADILYAGGGPDPWSDWQMAAVSRLRQDTENLCAGECLSITVRKTAERLLFRFALKYSSAREMKAALAKVNKNTEKSTLEHFILSFENTPNPADGPDRNAYDKNKSYILASARNIQNASNSVVHWSDPDPACYDDLDDKGRHIRANEAEDSVIALQRMTNVLQDRIADVYEIGSEFDYRHYRDRIRSGFQKSAALLRQYSTFHEYIPDLELKYVHPSSRKEDREEKGEIRGIREASPLSAFAHGISRARVLLSGAGGCGKTTSMIRYGTALAEKEPVIYLHLTDAADYAKQTGRAVSVEQYIREKFCAEDEELWTFLLKVANRAGTGHFRVTLLLDGLNELSVDDCSRLVREISALAAAWTNCDFILSTRNPHAILQNTQLSGFDFLEPVFPEEETVLSVLDRNGVRPPEDSKMLYLLRNPFILILYMKARPFIDQFGTIPALSGMIHSTMDTVGSVLEAYVAGQIHRCVTGMADGTEIISAFVTAEVFLPEIAWNMVLSDAGSVSMEDERKALRNFPAGTGALWDYCQDSRISDLQFIYGVGEYRWNMITGAHMVDLLDFLSLDRSDDNRLMYGFPHQLFRDYFAAKYAALHLRAASERREQDFLLRVLVNAPLEEDFLQLVSDILDEASARPRRTEDGSWIFPGKKEPYAVSDLSPAEQGMALLRDESGPGCAQAVANCFNLLSLARDGILANCSFRGLDLSLCELRNKQFTVWHRDRQASSIFDGAVIASSSLFCRWHTAEITAFCFTDRVLFSSDRGGTVIASDRADGRILRRWKLSGDEIRAMACRDQTVAACTAHAVYTADLETGETSVVKKTVRTHLLKIRFSGETLEFMGDSKPLVWLREETDPAQPAVPWHSGTVAVNAAGDRYWRKGLYKNLYSGTLSPEGAWTEKGRNIYGCFSPHIFSCSRMDKLLNQVYTEFPVSRKNRKKKAGVLKSFLWEKCSADPEIREVRQNLTKYLSSEERDPDPDEIRRLRIQLRKLISDVPASSGKISALSLSPDGRRLAAAFGNLVLELDAVTLKVIRSVRWPERETVTAVEYGDSEDSYLWVGLMEKILCLNKDLESKVYSAGELPNKRKGIHITRNGTTYVGLDDNTICLFDASGRIRKTRKVNGEGLLQMFEIQRESGAELYLAFPLDLRRWPSGMLYSFETDEYTPLGASYHDVLEDPDEFYTRLPEENRIYFHETHMLLAGPDGRLSRYPYPRGLTVQGCSFLGIRSDLTEEEKQIIRMNGGITE